MIKISLLGQKFNMLTVIELAGKTKRGRTLWKCKCDCGNDTFVETSSLNNGHVKSCGCLNHLASSLVGKKFGKLTVIERAGTNNWGGSRWLCRCECGTEKFVAGTGLKNGDITTCGCSRRLPRNLNPGEVAHNNLYAAYKCDARKNQREFSLSREKFKEITSSNCYYCGSEPAQIYRAKGSLGNYIYNGVDRLDNSLGYSEDNVVPCCGICNKIKLTHNLDFLVKHLTQMIKTIKQKEI